MRDIHDLFEPIRRLAALLRRVWDRWQAPRAFVWHSLVRVPWLCFYNTLGAALLVYLFAFDAQGLDLLRISTERGLSAAGILWNLLFLFGTFVLSLSFWYSSRLLLGRDFPTYRLDKDHAAVGRVWLPRILGAVVPLAIGLSFFRLHVDTAAARNLLGTLYLVLAALLLVFFIVRRRLPGVDATWMLTDRERPLPARDFMRIQWVISGSFVLLVGFMLAPVQLPQAIGAPAIIVLGIAGIALFGSMVLTYSLLVNERPAGTTFVLLLAFVFGFFNDNHAVRQGADGPGVARAQPAEHYAAWRSRRPPPAGTVREPAVFVSASGGGIRAAYWTASALAKMEHLDGFAANLFAISGVSGGSLGAVTYAAIKRHQLDGHAVDDLRQRVRQALAADFLSPVVAGLLFPDLVQRFLPLPIPWADRQRFLETSWEGAFGDASEILRARFVDLYAGEAADRLPSLLLNATLVESGQRAVVSNLALDGFSDTLDLLGDRYRMQNVLLSAAAGMSARFTYVSPAGTIENRDGERLRVVDGGYFENSGAASILDLLDQLQPQDGRWLPILVLIRNDPQADNVCRRDAGGVGTVAAKPGLNAAVSEAVAPFEALLHTRQARGRLAEVAAAREIEARGGVVVELSLAAVTQANLAPADDAEQRAAVMQRLVEPPLGWSLSDRVRHDMDRVMDGELGGLARELAVLDAALGGTAEQTCNAL